MIYSQSKFVQTKYTTVLQADGIALTLYHRSYCVRCPDCELREVVFTMASQEQDEICDLKFLEEDVHDLDETDYVSRRVIAFEDDREIPSRYLIRKIFSPHLEPPYHFHPAGDKPHRRRKVKRLFSKFFKLVTDSDSQSATTAETLPCCFRYFIYTEFPKTLTQFV